MLSQSGGMPIQVPDGVVSRRESFSHCSRAVGASSQISVPRHVELLCLMAAMFWVVVSLFPDLQARFAGLRYQRWSLRLVQIPQSLASSLALLFSLHGTARVSRANAQRPNG